MNIDYLDILDKIEKYLTTLKQNEKYMIIFTIILLFIFLFYQNIYISFKNDNNFNLLQKLSIEQKTEGVKKLIQEKSLKKN
jgi:predicted RND superfamily exporter protein